VRDDFGETLEDTRGQAKQEIDRIVIKGDTVSLCRIKARAIAPKRHTKAGKDQSSKDERTGQIMVLLLQDMIFCEHSTFL
jgi:hypothetical protein